MMLGKKENNSVYVNQIAKLLVDHQLALSDSNLWLIGRGCHLLLFEIDHLRTCWDGVIQDHQYLEIETSKYQLLNF
jgi:hypothetical protein